MMGTCEGRPCSPRKPTGGHYLDDSLKRLGAQVKPVVLDAAVGGVLPGQQPQTGDFLFRPEIDHQRVRVGRLAIAPEGVPEGVRLAVNAFSAGWLPLDFLAVHIDHLPAYMGNRFASRVQGVQFRERGELSPLCDDKRLQAKERALVAGNVMSCAALPSARLPSFTKAAGFNLGALHCAARRGGVFILD